MRNKHLVLASISTGVLVTTIGGLVFGVELPLPLPQGTQQLIEVPQAHAWGGSTWRRVRREARRARDRVRRELERARAQAERETKRAAARLREGDLSINLENVQNVALQRLSEISTATAPFLPASQIVLLSLAAIEYEAAVRELEALEIDPTEITPLRQRLDLAEQTLQRLESVRIDRSVQVGALPSPRQSVESATVARLESEHSTQYMAQLFVEAAVYQQLHGEIPNRRPVTLIYKIGQALVDYAQLKKDIDLISLTQREHAALYRELIENGRGASIAELLSSALRHLETMPVSGAEDPAIDPQSRVGRLVAAAETLVVQGERLLADQYRFPLMQTPSREIASITTALREMTHDPRNTATAWILLLPQHEIDALDDARGRLDRMRTSLQAIHIYTPQELVGVFFVQAAVLWPKYQAVPPGPLGPEHAVLALEIREIHDHLGQALSLVESRGLSLPGTFASTAKRALANLRTAAQDLERRSQMGGSSSGSPASQAATSIASSTRSKSSPSRMTKSKRSISVPVNKASSSSVFSMQTIRPLYQAPSSQSQSSTSASSIPAASSASETSIPTPTIRQLPQMSSIPSASSATVSTSASSVMANLTAPRIMQPASNPYDSYASTVTIVGYPDTRSVQILINGSVISYTPGAGKFSATVMLVPGKNLITVESADAQGARGTAVTLTVHYLGR